MPAHVNKRMPSSCEPCRRRKIRCHGACVPCETCVRRGRAAACQYQRDLATPLETTLSNSSETEKLSQRISHIEQLLEKQTAIISMRNPSVYNMHSPYRNRNPRSRPEVPVPTSSNPSQSELAGQPGIGSWRLLKSSSGHVRLLSQATGLDSVSPSPLSDQFPPCLGQQTNFPFSADVAASRQQLLDLLPPMSQCDRLKDVYMEVFSPLFHILHEPSFRSSYAEFRRQPTRVSLSFLALIFSVFGIAIMALADDDPLLDDLGHEPSVKLKSKSISGKYQSAAMKSLAADSFMWRHNLDTVKTLVLLIYSLSHTDGPAWSLLGTTLHIAAAIGCHVDPESLGNIHIIEAEERRRCWAALMMLYTIQNTCLGNMAPINVTANVKLPADLDDDELGCASPISSRRDGVPSKMAYILHKFNLYHLASRICQLPMPGTRIDYASILSLDRELEVEEANQAKRFGHLQNLPSYHQAHSHILSIYTSHLFVILHRSCMHSGADLSETDRHASIQRCIRHATRVLDSHNELCKRQTFRPYLWYAQNLGAFHAFLASAALIYVTHSPDMRQEVSISSIMPLLDSCLLNFQELSHRSEICLRSKHLLERAFAAESSMSPQNYSSISFSASQAYTSSPDTAEMVHARYATPGSLSQVETHSQENMADLSRCDATSLAGEFVGPSGWNANLDLVSFVSDMPHQHWLSPMAFSWDHWISSEAFTAPPGADFV
ncbi:hypothetical protein NQ176_g385 [Zarea fungicola]|uniref:Uncharacterized protein n=1 Tax=Zarea fungicola TaxID=93591 RepID=A0ACC1NY33_9HYPO|nr:hypothetical protein NQ176_g385 [Lecanicillium fungicola]